jgi:hypothetical protein
MAEPGQVVDYETVVRELHARIGTRVLVGIGTIDGGYGAGTIMGPLNRGQDVDYSTVLPELLGDVAGESIIFTIGVAGDATIGTFVLYRAGFEWGRLWDSMTGPAVSFAVEHIAVRVQPAPPLPPLPTA